METNVIRVKYDDMQFHYITSHYDLHWAGTCIYNGKIAEFVTRDETDYEAINDACPSCKDGGTNDYKDCTCEAYAELWCEIKELTFVERVKWFFKKQYYKHKYASCYSY